MGNAKQSFFKKNRLFLIIVTLIVLLIGSFISVQYVNSQKDDVPSETKPDDNEDGKENKEDDDNEGAEKAPVFSLFEASEVKDVISLKWRLDDNGKTTKAIQLYANDKFIADVIGYSAWSLDKSTYGYVSGDIEFKLVASFSEGEDIVTTTKLSLHTAIKTEVNISRYENEYTASITYSTNDGTDLQVPRIYLAGLAPEQFSIISIPSSKDGNGTTAAYVITVDPSVEKGFVINGRFIFDVTGDVKDFSITVE